MPNNVPSQVKLGVCSVTFDGTDLGFTQGGVEVEVSTETHEVLVDQFGTTPLAEQIMGRSVMVKVPLAETTLENLNAIMPGSTYNDSAGSGPYRTDVAAGIDINLLSTAAELRLRPKGNVDASEDFVVPLAATAGALQFAYRLDEERIFNVEFKGYVDTGNNDRLFYFGDPTATA